MKNLILSLMLLSAPLGWSFEGQTLCERPIELSASLLVCDSSMYALVDSKMVHQGILRADAKKLSFFGIDLEKLGIDSSFNNWSSRYYKIVDDEKLYGYREGMYVGREDFGAKDFIIGTYFNAEGKFLGAQIE